jgi:hypothetical protein
MESAAGTMMMSASTAAGAADDRINSAALARLWAQLLFLVWKKCVKEGVSGEA